ncbi:MAG: Rrf2 family transcriptional regulator [Oscillospiraceae bacterium]|nr:Rrf2 family transcriptional regulator [Oscillospiraceae bacterium]
MRVSTKGRYALRLMIDLAVHDSGEYTALKDVSARQGVSIKYLEQIVSLLGKAGLLKSIRGPQGGYRLARAPEEYTAGEILRLTEGSLTPVPCLDDRPNQCPRYAGCSTAAFWKGLEKAVSDYVDSVTLADLVWQETERGRDKI